MSTMLVVCVYVPPLPAFVSSLKVPSLLPPADCHCPAHITVPGPCPGLGGPCATHTWRHVPPHVPGGQKLISLRRGLSVFARSSTSIGRRGFRGSVCRHVLTSRRTCWTGCRNTPKRPNASWLAFCQSSALARLRPFISSQVQPRSDLTESPWCMFWLSQLQN